MLTKWNIMYPWQVKGRCNFFVRSEIAKVVFKNESSFKRRGISIHITFEQRDELYDIEGCKKSKFYKNQTKTISRIIEILAKNKMGE